MGIEGEPYTHKMVPSLTGFAPEWLVDERITGEEFHFDSDQKISNEEVLMDLGDDWPISYDDVAPYYDKVDQLIGVFGSKENLPNDPDSIFLPPPKPRLHELFIKEAGKALKYSGYSFPFIDSYQTD